MPTDDASAEAAAPSPRGIETAFSAAAALDAAGETDAARAAYLAILAAAPDHAATLNHAGSLLYRTGYRSAARTAFAQAAACHPGQPAGHVNLANLLARSHYLAALAADPECREAHQGLGNVLAALGDARGAAEHRRRGWSDRVFTPWRHYGPGAKHRVLLLTSVTDANVPVRSFLDDRAFAVTAVAAEFFARSMTLPPHDVVFNAIGDADACREALDAVAGLVTQAPILNRPDAVRATGRLANARRLGRGPDVRAPRMVLLRRRRAAALCDPGVGFPLLLRPPGFHTGQHFARVETPEELAEAAAAMPGDRLLAIEALPARGADGMARKCRVMLIGGRCYPLHLAISSDWKVHYFTAAMAERPESRAEERRFLADMPGYLGPRACAALAWIGTQLGLDYCGVDFAVGADGRLLLFEANATMALVPPPAGEMWDYRRPAFEAAVQAARDVVAGSITA
jgi:glutathione synthase/RimK-type ligase-like ATP-grasp enzyme